MDRAGKSPSWGLSTRQMVLDGGRVRSLVKPRQTKERRQGGGGVVLLLMFLHFIEPQVEQSNDPPGSADS